MATALSLLSRALRLCRAIDPGEGPTAAEAQDALEALNAMLDAWRVESTLVYAMDRQVFNLVVNQASYPIGPGATWNTTRPVRIERASFVNNSTTPAIEDPQLRVLSDEEYQWEPHKGMAAEWPEWLYYDRAYPLGNVILPPPSIARQIALYLWHPLSQVPTLGTEIDFPPGYREAVTFNLTMRLAPEYGATVSEDVKVIARSSKAQIENTNIHVPPAQFDQGLGRRHRYGWDGVRGT